MSHRSPILVVVLAVAPSVAALAAPQSAGTLEAVAVAPPASSAEGVPAEPTASKFKLSIGGGYLYQFESSFDDGPGDVAVQRGYAVANAGFALSPEFDLGLRLAWEGGWYDFSGPNNLSLGTGRRPWNAVQSVQLGGQLGWRLDEHWRLGFGLFGTASGENDADVGDSLSVGGTLSAAYRFDENFTIGGGVLVASQIEDDALFIPLLVIDWRINDQWRLSNIAGPEAYPTGAGLELSYRPVDAFELGLGGRWESRRFRLDDDAPAPEGVGEDSSLGVWLRAGLFPAKNVRIDVLGGVMLFERMRLDNSNGDRLAADDVDPAPFVGAFVGFRF